MCHLTKTMELLSLVLLYLVHLLDPALCVDCASNNPIPGIITCLSNITYGVNKTNILAGTDTETIRAYCEEGTFNTAIECLKEFYQINDRCKSSESGLHLSMPSNMPAKLSASVHKLCSSLTEHALHSDCIVQQRPFIQKCLKKNDAIFQHKQKEQPKTPSRRTVAYNICNFYKGIEVCTGKYVENRCDRDTGLLLGQFIHDITPLNCSIAIPLPTSNSHTIHRGHSSFTYCVLSAVLSLSASLGLRLS